MKIILKKLLGFLDTAAANLAQLCLLLKLLESLSAFLDEILDIYISYIVAYADYFCNFFFKHILFVGLLAVVLDSGPESPVAQYRAVDLVVRQATQLAYYILRLDLVCLFYRHSLDHLAHHGGAGNGAGTSVGLPLYILDLVIFDLDSYQHLVAAGDVSHLAPAVGLVCSLILKYIAWIGEMVLHLLGINP